MLHLDMFRVTTVLSLFTGCFCEKRWFWAELGSHSCTAARADGIEAGSFALHVYSFAGSSVISAILLAWDHHQW